MSLSERFEVLRDEALNTSEHGEEAPGREIFDAISYRIDNLQESERADEMDIDLSLHDALSRRLAWGEDPTTVLLDCQEVSQRVLDAVRRSFSISEEAIAIIAIVTVVSCAASRHLARLSVERASKEKGKLRREMMAQRQLKAVLEEQETALNTP